jgi:hypothetical protein
MSCDRAYRLLDDYLEYRLSKRDRQRLETHIVHCPRCAKELRTRPALDHQVRLALGISVQPLCLAPDASTRIVRAAQGSVRRGIWLSRAMSAGRVLVGAASVMLLVAGLAYLLGRATLPWTQEPRDSREQPSISLGSPLPESKATQPAAPPSEIARDGVLEPRELYSDESFTPIQLGPDASFGRSQPVTFGAVQFEPGLLQIGEPFTTTILVRNEQDQPLPVSQLNLDIEGPQHSYHFELAVSGPLPAERVSALCITPDSLAEASEERYQVSPDDIIDVPGVYIIRVTLFHAATVPGRHD